MPNSGHRDVLPWVPRTYFFRFQRPMKTAFQTRYLTLATHQNLHKLNIFVLFFTTIISIFYLKQCWYFLVYCYGKYFTKQSRRIMMPLLCSLMFKATCLLCLPCYILLTWQCIFPSLNCRIFIQCGLSAIVINQSPSISIFKSLSFPLQFNLAGLRITIKPKKIKIHFAIRNDHASQQSHLVNHVLQHF